VEVTDVTTTIRTVTTDSDGNWVASVAAGAVTTHIVETDPLFTTGYIRTEGNGDDSANAVRGVPASVEINGYYFPGNVTGHVYLDRNGNRTQDVGEVNLSGVEISVTDSKGTTTVITTDANGAWFISLPPGTVNIDIDPTGTTLPAGYIQSEGTNPTRVTVLSGQTVQGGIDGYFIPATVTGHLYLDTNGNGSQDPGEPDAPGISVTVVGSDGVVLTAVTQADGNWMAFMPPGITVVDVDEADPEYPAGSVQTQGLPVTTVTAVAGGSVSGGINGYFTPVVVTGHLYLDLNGNGQQDFVYHNLANVDILVTDSTGKVHRVTTNASGDWTASIPPGPATATVDASDPEYPTGSVITQGAVSTPFNAEVGVPVDITDVGFFFPAVVTGHLYLDANGNGRHDAGELDLQGISITVTSAINNPQTVSTDIHGNWLAIVPPGATTVDIAGPVG
jgi:hypothetical protein